MKTTLPHSKCRRCSQRDVRPQKLWDYRRQLKCQQIPFKCVNCHRYFCTNDPSSILIEGGINIKISVNVVHHVCDESAVQRRFPPRSWAVRERPWGQGCPPASYALVIHPTECTLAPMFNISNRGRWLRNPIDFEGANKQAKLYVGRSLTLQKFSVMPKDRDVWYT